ncbi:MAG: M23 family metallopeptidase [Bacteroidota bacterium]
MMKRVPSIFAFIFCGGIVLFLLAFNSIGRQDKNYPQDYFRSPVDTEIRLSGTFGELRPNHLHAGIDIKAWNGKTGQSIYSVADGYISRIKVQTGGYGNVLYINHPNGYTSVYAHLQNFPEEVAAYVKRAQYRKQSFAIELFPKADRFPLKKGDIIGQMGLSGRSFGPHLHFEIRDTKTEKPINPLLFGFQARDQIPPKLHGVKVYYLNEKQETYQSQQHQLIKKKGGYRIKGDTLLIGAWRAGFALKAYDHMNKTPNWNGIYALSMFQDDVPVYEFAMETFAFSESRYINAHLDYAEQVAKKSYFNRCYALPGNKLSIYQTVQEKGVIKLHRNKASKITMIAKDVAGNESELTFWVRRDEVKAPKNVVYNYQLPYQEENIIETDDLYLYFPKGTLYENLYLRYQRSKEQSNNVYSAVHHVHDFQTPVHRYFDLAIRPGTIPDSLKDKAFVAYCDPKNRIQSCGGQWNEGRLEAKVRDLGDYYIMLDTKAPKIKPVRFRSNMNGYSKMTFKITDDIKTARNVEQLYYEATIDGQWVLLEFDAKNDLLTHRFDEQTGPGTHEFRLIVSDHRGNETVFERTFRR